MLLRSGITAFVCLLSLTSIVLVIQLYSRKSSPSTGWIPSFGGHSIEPCPDRLDWLDRLNLTYPIRYAHRDIITRPTSKAKRDPVTKMKEHLFPQLQTIDLSDNPKVELQHCNDPLVLDVPATPKDPVDASHVIFGVSTTIKRLEDTIPQLLRWLPHTNAKLFAVVIEAGEVDEETQWVAADTNHVAELQIKMRGLGLDVTLVEPLRKEDIFSERYFSLAEIMYTNRNPETEWVALMDDDTFFPSIPSVLSMLSEYDFNEQFYIGALSEDWWSVVRYGMMGFGGAGIFLSVAMAKSIHNNYDHCKADSGSGAGDIRIMECIIYNTNTKLTNVPELHQIDVHNDLSGIYESGRMPLSLHHWKGGGPDGKGYDLPKMHLVADVCGDCFLQRWQFGKDTLLSNGFSISMYPKGSLDGMDFGKLEETWDTPSVVEGSVNAGTAHSLGPTRRKMVLEEEKVQYRLMDSVVIDGVVRQTYLHPGVEGDIDTVLELVWVRGKKADGPL